MWRVGPQKLFIELRSAIRENGRIVIAVHSVTYLEWMPGDKLTTIGIGGGDWVQCRETPEQILELMREAIGKDHAGPEIKI